MSLFSKRNPNNEQKGLQKSLFNSVNQNKPQSFSKIMHEISCYSYIFSDIRNSIKIDLDKKNTSKNKPTCGYNQKNIKTDLDHYFSYLSPTNRVSSTMTKSLEFKSFSPTGANSLLRTFENKKGKPETSDLDRFNFDFLNKPNEKSSLFQKLSGTNLGKSQLKK